MDSCRLSGLVCMDLKFQNDNFWKNLLQNWSGKPDIKFFEKNPVEKIFHRATLQKLAVHRFFHTGESCICLLIFALIRSPKFNSNKNTPMKKLATLAFLLLFLAKMAVSQCLAGKYTIGGVAPDFVKIQDAIDSLNTKGWSDTVRFEIRPGIYEEQLLAEIVPTCSVYPLFFQKETGSIGDVVLTWPANSAVNSNFVLKIDGYFDARFEGLIFERSPVGTMPNRTLVDHNNAVVSFKNCRFLGQKLDALEAPGTENQHTLVKAGGNAMFENCQFQDGAWAIWSPSGGLKLTVKNCDLIGQALGGIWLQSFNGPVEVRKSRIDVGVLSSSRGIFTEFCYSNIQICQNTIKSSGSGIRLESHSIQNLSDRGIIAHNFIIAPNGDAGYFTGSIYLAFVFNTVRAAEGLTVGTSEPLYNINGSTHTIGGNIFDISNSSTMHLLTKNDLDLGVFQSNCYMPNASQNGVVTTAFLGQVFGFSEWKTGDRERYSINKSVNFVAADDLHIAGPDEDINGRAIGFAAYWYELYDIDGDSLPADGWYDIGADQIALPVSNGSLKDANGNLALHQPCGENVDIKFGLKNEGEKDITQAIISWKINGQSQPDFVWSGQIAAKTTDTLTLATLPFLADSSYKITLQIVQINGREDIYEGYNSWLINVLSDISAGDVTVGIGGKFASVRDLNDRLQKSGACGSLRIVLLSGTHYGSLVLGKKLAIPANSTFEIAGEPGGQKTTIWRNDQGNYQTATLQLDSAAQVSIHDLTIIATNDRGGLRAHGSHDIQVENCTILGESGNVVARLEGSQNITFDRCELTRTSNGERCLIAENCLNIVLQNCTISKNPEGLPAILFDFGGRSRIQNCRIRGGTSVQSCQKFDFLQNECLMDVILSFPAPSGFEAIVCDSVQVANCLFTNINLPTSSVFIYETSHLWFAHNTILSKTSSPGSAAFFIRDLTGAQIPDQQARIFNNIFKNETADGVAFTIGTPETNFVADRNCFWSGGPVLAAVAGQTDLTTLADLQNFNGQNANSLQFNVEFLADANLRIFKKQSKISGKGVFLLNFSEKDIDGDPRPAGSVDIGADQFSGRTTEAKISNCNHPQTDCHGLPGVFVKIKNDGPDTLRHLKIDWQVTTQFSAAKNPVFNWSGELPGGAETDWVKLGDGFEYDFDSTHLEIKLADATDSDTTNNQYIVEKFSNRMGGDYLVGGVDGDFPTVLAAMKMLQTAGVCAPVNIKIRPVSETGSYFGAAPGSSATNRIVFEPANPGFGQVELIWFDNWGLSHAEFRRLRIAGHGFNNSTPRHRLTFESCQFTDQFLDNTYNDSYISFKNCQFNNSYFNFGSFLASEKDTSTYFENCDFGSDIGEPDGQFNDVSVSGIENLTMKNCRFHRTSSVNLNYLSGKAVIEGNVFASSPALTVDYCETPAGKMSRISNNFFRYKGQGFNNASFNTTALVQLYDSKNLEFSHNSLLFEPTNGLAQNPSAIHVYNPIDNVLLQNNLIKIGAGTVARAFNWSGDYANNLSNFNHFELGTGGFYNGFPSQAEWVGLSGFDSNSTQSPVKLEAENDPTGLSVDLHLDENSPNIPLTINVLSEITTDFDGQTRGLTETAIGADEPGNLPLAGAVWPGDCDRDKQVTTLDWLHLGLAIGQNLVGPARSDQSISWSPKFAADWPDSVQNVNSKHVDCDGDGQVLMKDTAAIVQNFDLQHAILGLPADRSGTMLKIELPAGPYFSGQKIAAPIMLGEAAESFYGLAFDLDFSKNSIVPGSFWVDFQNSWLAQNPANSMVFYKKEGFSGHFPVAFVKTNGQDANGFGQIGTLNFTVGELADSLKIEVIGTHGILSNGDEKPIDPINPPAVGILLSEKNVENELAFQIYPNPSNGRFWVENLPADLVEIHVFDPLGRLVFSKKTAQTKIQIDLGERPNGLYEIQILSEEGRSSRVIAVQK